MTIFVISDTHFCHDNMYKFTTFGGTERVRGKFSCCSDGDEFMVDAWNSVVGVEDHVWHLGDVSMGRRGMTVAIYKVCDLVKKAKEMLKREGHPVTSLAIYKLIPSIRRAELKKLYRKPKGD